MIAVWATFICWLAYRHSANVARLDPLDQTAYQLSNEQAASRCRSVALCESARLTCSVAKRVTTDKVAHDCRISNVTESADRADIIKNAFSGTFEAYRYKRFDCMRFIGSYWIEHVPNCLVVVNQSRAGPVLGAQICYSH